MVTTNYDYIQIIAHKLSERKTIMINEVIEVKKYIDGKDITEKIYIESVICLQSGIKSKGYPILKFVKLLWDGQNSIMSIL